jgi:hypothetical protein
MFYFIVGKIGVALCSGLYDIMKIIETAIGDNCTACYVCYDMRRRPLLQYLASLRRSNIESYRSLSREQILTHAMSLFYF